jgi:hypothetical protein
LQKLYTHLTTKPIRQSQPVEEITAGLCGDPIVVRKSAKSSSNAFGNGIVSRQASAFGKWNAEECTVVPCLLVAV